MKKILTVAVLAVLMISCKSKGQDVETQKEETEEIAYASFGNKIDDDNVMSISQMSEKYKSMSVGDTMSVKMQANVIEVCQSKGCWMTLNLENGDEAMVKFKDYGFFMPKDISGKEVILNGKAFVNEVPVDEQRHYAEDAGKSKEEIATITEPKKTFSFEADGVLIKQQQLQRKVITTADGSKTIHLVEWDEHYHSIHGAIQEANHVYIKHGLLFFVKGHTQYKLNFEYLKQTDKTLSILEIGYGTGLNAFITLIEAQQLNVQIDYVGVEAFPISMDELKALNYAEQLNFGFNDEFKKMHQISWEAKQSITPYFSLTKQKKTFDSIEDMDLYDLIYFDAFSARVQPELWTETIFKKMFDSLKSNGVMVTYAAKGSVRRAMQAVGFSVEKLPGPPGKREMLRALKNGSI